MATADTRRALASRRRSERDRKARLRSSMKLEGIPSRAAIDKALALAVRRTILTKYGEPSRVAPGSDLQAVVREATEILGEAGFRLHSPRGRVLFASALGE